MPEAQIVVTGASRGIGAAIVTELVARGRAVVGLSRGGESPAGRAIACDVTDEAAVRVALAEIASAGPIAALVNNAGLHLADPSATLTTARYEQVMALNATAVMVGCREVHPHLVANGGGCIVNIGSFFDKLGVAENLAYCASKAAVGAMTRCLAVEWARDHIAVVDVAPGYIETDLNRDFLARDSVRRFLERRIPVGRPGTPQEVARLVAAIVCADIPFLTGETIYLDGGQGMAH
ncbi:MAG: SDR family oxidoreductase [Ectothiorhodospiraceae bacterium]|nr:SDR family oxidoreductase [Ectothiorhodospiraceae bacterium]